MHIHYLKLSYPKLAVPLSKVILSNSCYSPIQSIKIHYLKLPHPIVATLLSKVSSITIKSYTLQKPQEQSKNNQENKQWKRRRPLKTAHTSPTIIFPYHRSQKTVFPKHPLFVLVLFYLGEHKGNIGRITIMKKPLYRYNTTRAFLFTQKKSFQAAHHMPNK